MIIDNHHLQRLLSDSIATPDKFHDWVCAYDSTSQSTILHWWDQKHPRLIVPPKVCGVAGSATINPISVFIHASLGDQLFCAVTRGNRMHHVIAYMVETIHVRLITRSTQQVVASCAVRTPEWAHRVHEHVKAKKLSMVQPEEQRLRHWVQVRDALDAIQML